MEDHQRSDEQREKSHHWTQTGQVVFMLKASATYDE